MQIILDKTLMKNYININNEMFQAISELFLLIN